MKQITLLAIAFFVLSCQNKDKEPKLLAENVPAEKYTDMYGSWVGAFTAENYGNDNEDEGEDLDVRPDFSYTNKINLVIKRISEGKVLGQSIVAGNVRPFKGSYTEKDGILSFNASEPGDGKNDGKFVFTIEAGTLKGKWLANDKKAYVRSRKYELQLKPFQYNAGAMLPKDREYIDYATTKEDTVNYKDEDGKIEKYVQDMNRFASEEVAKINASTEKLDTEKLKNLKKLDLEILRNTIYARHGYSFKKRGARQFFDDVDWYVPVSTNVDAELTQLEKENIMTLKKFEQYATDNYEHFGR